MGELLIAIALLCQVHGNDTRDASNYYETAKEKQKKCQQKLVKCLYNKEDLSTAKKLAECIEKGDY